MTDPTRPGDADPPPTRTVLDLVPSDELAGIIHDRFDAAIAVDVKGRGRDIPPAVLAEIAAKFCVAPATMIVFRGKTRRLYLCAAHRGRYTGSGKVAPYRGLSQFDPPEDPRPGEFTGPVRRCGEETS